MNDIITRLRDYSPENRSHVVHEAADEIERLRKDAARWRYFEKHAHIVNDNPRNWGLAVSNRRMSLAQAVDAEISADSRT
jgi:hypothetical protein